MVLFVIEINHLLNGLPAGASKKNFQSQLSRSASSIGANFTESNAAESRNDFIHKLSIALKEAEESRFWLRCIEAEFPENDAVKKLYTECTEFIKILQSCVSKAKRNLGQ